MRLELAMRRANMLPIALCLQLASAGLALAGQSRSVVAYPTPVQEVTYDQGTAFVTSRGQSTIILSAQPLSKSKAWLSLSIINNSGEPLTVFDSQVGARDRSGPVPVIHADAIVAAEKKKQFWESLGTELAAGINTYTANQQGHYSETGTFSGRVGSYGNGERVAGTYTATGTDAAARQAAIAENNRANEAMMEALKAEHQARLSSVNAGLFKSQTIPAGGAYSGRLQIALPNPTKGSPSLVVVEATVGSERHEFLVFVDGAPNAEQSAKVASLYSVPAPSPDVAASEALAANPHDVRSSPPPPQMLARRESPPMPSAGEARAPESQPTTGLFRDAIFGASSIPFKTLQSEAKRGDSSAQFELGRIYAAGNIVASDPSAALTWFRRAEEQGHSGAQLALGLIHLAGKLGQKPNPALASTYLQRAAVRGDPKTDLILGLIYVMGGPGLDRDVAKGLELLRRSSDSNYPLAEFLLGMMYLSADSGVASNPERAFALFRRAAAEADPATLGGIAAAYTDRDKTPKSVEGDVAYFQGKAENGQANAQFLVGMFYAAGVVLPADEEKSIAWLTRSARQGNAAACLALGMYFESKNEMVSAYAWVLVASQAGFPLASSMLSEWEKRMTPRLVAEAKSRASLVRAVPEAMKR